MRLGPSESLSGPLEQARPIQGDVEAETAWRTGLLVFRERPLAEVVKEVERLYPYQLNSQKPLSELIADIPPEPGWSADV